MGFDTKTIKNDAVLLFLYDFYSNFNVTELKIFFDNRSNHSYSFCNYPYSINKENYSLFSACFEYKNAN